MIDFHSHILPGVDDGSKNIQESLRLLSMMKRQGVQVVIATPHYYAGNETPESFVDRRQKAFEQLCTELPEGYPQILLGAEVEYYEGISKLQGLDLLTFGAGKLLLVEMPMRKWSELAVNELKTLSCIKGYTVILAHIERYMRFQNPDIWKRLREFGILMQVNASFFNGMFTKRKALSMLYKGHINVIGSDCHNVEHRPPAIGESFETIRLKAGDKFLSDFTEYNKSLLFVD